MFLVLDDKEEQNGGLENEMVDDFRLFTHQLSLTVIIESKT